MPELASELVEALRSARAALCTVESCTGGRIAAALTDVPGASAVYWGGMTVYDNSAKSYLAGVQPDVISSHGAVSREVASALAFGGLARLQQALKSGSLAGIPSISAERLFCVATTGIAGPSGGSAEKPVGLCWIAVADSRGGVTAIEYRVPETSSRDECRAQFTEEALRRALAAVRHANCFP